MYNLNSVITAIRLAKKLSLKYIFIKVNPSSFLEQFLNLLVNEGFIKSYKMSIDKKTSSRGIKIFFRFDSSGKNIIRNIKFLKGNALATNLQIRSLWKKQRGEGVFILATPLGLKTDNQARFENVGGKLVAVIV